MTYNVLMGTLNPAHPLWVKPYSLFYFYSSTDCFCIQSLFFFQTIVLTDEEFSGDDGEGKFVSFSISAGIYVCSRTGICFSVPNNLSSEFEQKNKRMLSLLWKNITSLLWHYWFGRHEGHPACKSLVLVCRWWWFDWSFARLIAPVVITTSIVLSSIKSRMETFWYRLNPGSPG